MQASQECKTLIKRFEGCRLTAYQCSAGKFTIGYGHTGADVSKGMTISQKQADELFEQDLVKFEQYVSKLVKVSLNQNQFDALVSWTYNLGPGNLGSSALLKELNAGNYDKVPVQMNRWVFSGKVKLPGLIERRAIEAELFANPIVPIAKPSMCI